ncbi:hypothetical protein [Desulfatitalea tepidiphila]|uniref:hypothetical protein n=1 Tax=Desulfatitalea tepidiphila TaxID=1185843 RepID=UPI0006B588F5|nr:hypothetical protein [Desulfatitalea tepidiphila]
MNDRLEERHLSEDDFIQAVVERDSLPDSLSAHLAGCPSCAERLRRFESRLAGMGRMARSSAPLPARPFRLTRPDRKEPLWQRKSILAMGLSGMVLLAVVVWRPAWFTAPRSVPAVAFDAAADRRLMEDIDAIVDNALPEAYQQVVSFNTPDFSDSTSDEQDVFDWIVPSTDEEDDDFLS